MSTDALIAQRQATHGSFADTASHAQRLKAELRTMPNWGTLTAAQREALELIATKLARIGCGNPDELDHWRDVGGYARLGEANE